MTQYELRWAAMPPPVGRRPVLLLSRTEAFRYLEWAIVAGVTTSIRGIPQEVRVGADEGLHVPSVVNLDNIYVARKAAIGALIGRLPVEKVAAVKRALGFALDWAELQDLGSVLE